MHVPAFQDNANEVWQCPFNLSPKKTTNPLYLTHTPFSHGVPLFLTSEHICEKKSIQFLYSQKMTKNNFEIFVIALPFQCHFFGGSGRGEPVPHEIPLRV